MRIGIANDVILSAEILRRIILRAGVHDVAWIVHDGAEAVARCQRDKPDMILMDLFMPKLDGVQAIKKIMAQTPCAIVVASSKVQDHTAKVFEAMGAGALDAVSIPTYTDVDHIDESPELLAKIETINKLVGEPKSLSKHRSDPKTNRTSVRSRAEAVTPTGIHRAHKLIVIGSSAGGPAALTTILAAFPVNLPASVIIVQHVDKQFAQGLTAWFTSHSKLDIRVAHEGDRLEPGVVYLAGQDRHLVMFSPTQLGYTSHPIESSYCPSVDVFFKSVAKFWRGDAVGVLLTGMGRDGAEGLKALRDSGHHTIAQDKGTSAIYGMPKAAAEINAAKEILALDKIGPRLTTLITKG